VAISALHRCWSAGARGRHDADKQDAARQRLASGMVSSPVLRLLHYRGGRHRRPDFPYRKFARIFAQSLAVDTRMTEN
jgi:hypothetical protein